MSVGPAVSWLTGPAFDLGALKPLSDLPAIGADPVLRERLELKGLRLFAEAARPMSDHLEAAVRACLKSADVNANEVKAVVVASGSDFRDREFDLQVFAALRALDLDNLTPIGVSMSECANLSSALLVADALVRSGSAGEVLVIICDAPPVERLYGVDTAVLSDGASACLVSSRPRGRVAYELRNVVVRSNARHAGADLTRGSFARFLRVHLDGFSAAFRAMARAEGLEPSQVTHFLPPNLNYYAADFLAAAAGVPKDCVFKTNIPAIGHVQGSDPLINLASLEQSGGCTPGDTIVVAALGPHSWGVVILGCVAIDPAVSRDRALSAASTDA
ncbi:MAG: hypothetical protein IOD03_15980 [Methylocystis sp.]|uniref:3-oxoacyl-[acyl-carrier-protein] synthase III C-terminal domain-containing protein n=1 Tax=Phenylobacterium sp. TaxID=1871053 RepID=UPI0025E9BC5E|nr:3-oxoacyl-[acyl-carrier-protein] synthase III C-terminal domain-containing protein [Phenylobacterium sp.]MCA3585177.1 hypothetical protein [Methylocystis sp.]MCA6288057.1 hypothetical protein [Phenylobacterium sp.]MCA6346662.1 hypothetical protein [Phenylobacterium sp.]MCA6349258.1 hypothetical protein [Phenylobacterium sp.]MCA6352220.1 hypothetical protein [Phenylobacterium sp.]